MRRVLGAPCYTYRIVQHVHTWLESHLATERELNRSPQDGCNFGLFIHAYSIPSSIPPEIASGWVGSRRGLAVAGMNACLIPWEVGCLHGRQVERLPASAAGVGALCTEGATTYSQNLATLTRPRGLSLPLSKQTQDGEEDPYFLPLSLFLCAVLEKSDISFPASD